MKGGVDDWDQHWHHFAESTRGNPAQSYRRRLIMDVLPTRPGLRVLDIGSGQGDLADELTRRRPDISLVGLDISDEGVRVARAKVPTATFHVVDLLGGEPFPQEITGWADVAVCSEVLEHLDEPVQLLRTAAQGLAPSSLLIVTVPGGIRTAYDRHIGHRCHYQRDGLRNVLVEAGFEVLTVSAAGFPFFNLYKLLVAARGARLAEDSRSGEGRPSILLRLGSWVFGGLFRLNFRHTRWGWQLVAVARTRQVT